MIDVSDSGSREKVLHFAWFRLERLIDWLEDVADGAARYFTYSLALDYLAHNYDPSDFPMLVSVSYFPHRREATEEGNGAFQVFCFQS